MNNVVKVSEVVTKMKLKNLTPDVDISKLEIRQQDINRPALQLSGYFAHFSSKRVQVVGMVEHSYVETLDAERKKEVIDKFFSYEIPCIIICRNLVPDEYFMEAAIRAGVPIFSSEKGTSQFSAELIRLLNSELAPRISIHGVFVEVYGIGVLIMGESGIGKSEAALELVKRGHRLISDDVVDIRKISEDTLIGTAPDITRHFIELRGIGIVDVKNLYGALAVRESQEIELVITLEEWDKAKIYDRLGMEEQYVEFLGNNVVAHQIPIRPGRNLAIIVETAAINHRQKRMGYNAAEELYRRVQNNLKKNKL